MQRLFVKDSINKPLTCVMDRLSEIVVYTRITVEIFSVGILARTVGTDNIYLILHSTRSKEYLELIGTRVGPVGRHNEYIIHIVRTIACPHWETDVKTDDYTE